MLRLWNINVQIRKGICHHKLKSILYWVWFGAMLHFVIRYQTSSAILEKWYQTVQDVKHAGVHP